MIKRILVSLIFLLIKEAICLETRSIENSKLESYSVTYSGSLQKLSAHSSLFSNSQFESCNTLCDDFDPTCDCNTVSTTETEITIEQVDKWIDIIKKNAEAAANPVLKNELTTNTDTTESNNQYVWIGIGVGAIILIGLIIFFITKSRSNGAPGRDPNANYNMQGGVPGMMPGGMPGMPGGMPGMPGGMPGMPGMPGGMPGMPGMPGGMPGMMPGGMPGMPGMMPGMMPGGMPGMPGGMPMR
ncbi:transmembrane domain-containing protein [Cryptosporidium canis]|uniref:Transmembrane domain-containing protein n=1 Tax=Cryptosporidium canis TaxID=195482 RepID=A0A9D5HZ88_9CRYT|nr:transmembrane domain-containing protein [Cryptosporidium canis]